jgi:hypothetical protein
VQSTAKSHETHVAPRRRPCRRRPAAAGAAALPAAEAECEGLQCRAGEFCVISVLGDDGQQHWQAHHPHGLLGL